MAEFKVVAKLGPKELGDPTKARDLKEGDNTVIVLGTIFGEARGLSYRANDNNPEEPSIALTGVFEGVPVDGDVTIRSNTLFLPSTIQAIFVNGVRGDNAAPIDKAPKRGAKLDVSGNVLRLAVEIGVKKANNAVGYAYDIRILGDATVDNTLDAMREDVKNRKAIAPARAAPQIAAKPETAAQKKKRLADEKKAAKK